VQKCEKMLLPLQQMDQRKCHFHRQKQDSSYHPFVNLTNILRAAFAEKLQQPNCKYRKAAGKTLLYKKAPRKMWVTLTPCSPLLMLVMCWRN